MGTPGLHLDADLTWEESASPQPFTVSPRAADPAQGSHTGLMGFLGALICQICLPPSDSQHNESFWGEDSVCEPLATGQS